jgi:hypothetical protein
MPDIQIKCNCGESFTFTESEQEFFSQKGFQAPKKCPKCRKARKTSEADNCRHLVSQMISDLGFVEGTDFTSELNNVENKNIVVINCLNNDISRVLLYNKGEEASAIRIHSKNVAKRNGIFINVDIKKFVSVS